MIQKLLTFGKVIRTCLLVCGLYASFHASNCFAQTNLVQNGGFEDRDLGNDWQPWGRSDYNGLNGDQLKIHCLHWQRTFSTKTSDYFNSIVGGTCSVGIPNNQLGVQAAAGGDAYAGAALTYGDTEFFTGELTSPLDTGYWYEISFKVSLAETSTSYTKVGAYLTDHILGNNEAFYWNYVPVVTSDLIDNTTDWVTVKAVFKATQPDLKYISLGDGVTSIDWAPGVDYVRRTPGSMPGCTIPFDEVPTGIAYYYFDDVKIVKIPTPCGGQYQKIFIEGSSSNDPDKCCIKLTLKVEEGGAAVKSIRIDNLDGSPLLAKTELSSIVKAGQTLSNAVEVCIDKTSDVKKVKIYYYGEDDVAICPVEEVLYCPCFCSTENFITSYAVKIPGNPNECCWNVSIQNNNPCVFDLKNGISLQFVDPSFNVNSQYTIGNAANGEWAGQIKSPNEVLFFNTPDHRNYITGFGTPHNTIYLGDICINKTVAAGTNPGILKFMISKGNGTYDSCGVNLKTLNCNNGSDSCCSKLTATVQPGPNGDCPMDVIINQTDPTIECAIYGVELVPARTVLNSVYQPAHVTNLKPWNPASPIPVNNTKVGTVYCNAGTCKFYVKFLDKLGRTICIKTLYANCGILGSNKYNNEPDEDIHAISPVSKEIPALSVYPNPATDKITVGYEVKNNARTKIELLDINGGLIKIIDDAEKTPGYYSLEYDASGLSSGIYLIRLSAGGYTSVSKMVIAK